jgi:hypothetical protein
MFTQKGTLAHARTCARIFLLCILPSCSSAMTWHASVFVLAWPCHASVLSWHGHGMLPFCHGTVMAWHASVHGHDSVVVVVMAVVMPVVMVGPGRGRSRHAGVLLVLRRLLLRGVGRGLRYRAQGLRCGSNRVLQSVRAAQEGTGTSRCRIVASCATNKQPRISCIQQLRLASLSVQLGLHEAVPLSVQLGLREAVQLSCTFLSDSNTCVE